MTARATAHDLSAFVVPDARLARAAGLDLPAAGLTLAATPRHASVLLLTGELPPGLAEAATVVYAQMPRPRAILALGVDPAAPLPAADVVAPLDQTGLVAAADRLRQMVATGAWAPDVPSFDGITREEATDAPAMDHAGMGHSPAMHDAMAAENAPGPDHSPHAGHHAPPQDTTDHTRMDHSTPMDHATMDHHAMDHGGMDHEAMDHSGHTMGGFMSMVAMTNDLPRSRDGLPMEWVEVPFGPLFPGLPGGLALTLTLDGDGVAKAAIAGGVVARDLAATWPGPAIGFPTRLSRLDPLAPVAYRDLARRALAAAAGLPAAEAVARAWIGAVERERAAGHLGWLAQLGYLVGDVWLAQRSAVLQLALIRAASEREIAQLRPAIDAFARRVGNFPPIRQRLAGVGDLYRTPAAAARGPVARARGIAEDARTGDAAYQALGFTPRVDDGGDALACLRVRLAEIAQSLELVLAVGAADDVSDPAIPDDASGEGMATVETPRGAASLHLTLERGMVTHVHLDTPSTHLASLVPELVARLEVADALVAVAALDLSPWEMDR